MVSKGQFVGLDWNRIARLHTRQILINAFNTLFFFFVGKEDEIVISTFEGLLCSI